MPLSLAPSPRSQLSSISCSNLNPDLLTGVYKPPEADYRQQETNNVSPNQRTEVGYLQGPPGTPQTSEGLGDTDRSLTLGKAPSVIRMRPECQQGPRTKQGLQIRGKPCSSGLGTELGQLGGLLQGESQTLQG